MAPEKSRAEAISIVLSGLCLGSAAIFCLTHHICIRNPGEPLDKLDLLDNALASFGSAAALGIGAFCWLRLPAQEASRSPGRASGLGLPALRALTAAGVAFYALAAGSDAFMTMNGLGSDVSLEGNAFLRELMRIVGIQPALALAKLSTGLALWLVAARVGRAIHDDEAWIEKVPTLPPVRRWMRSGDRSWVALLPLYGVAASQAFAACAWLWLKLGGGR